MLVKELQEEPGCRVPSDFFWLHSDKFLLKQVRPRGEEPEADTPSETVALENAKKQRTAAAPIALANAGMNGYFSGEPPTGYRRKQQTQAAPGDCSEAPPATGVWSGVRARAGHERRDGTPNRPTMGRLNQGSNHRATLSSVRAHRTAMESLLPEGRPLVLVGIGPGVRVLSRALQGAGSGAPAASDAGPCSKPARRRRLHLLHPDRTLGRCV